MTAPSAIQEAKVLQGIPTGLRKPLLSAYAEILRNFRERRWEPSELNGGKLCEICYTILRGHVDGSFPAKPSKPKNMVDACKDLEKASASFPRSVCIQIPRMLIAQLATGGRLVAPVGEAGGQELLVMTKDDQVNVCRRSVASVAFVRMQSSHK